MTTEQITYLLNQKGFQVSATDNVVAISLNRSISIMEVEIALNFGVEREHMWKDGDVVKVLGL